MALFVLVFPMACQRAEGHKAPSLAAAIDVPDAAVPDASPESRPDAYVEAVVLPAQVEQVAVAKDSPASFVRGTGDGAPHIVFMAGICSSAYAYLTTFPEAARAHGGILAIEGDQPCAGVPGFHSYSWSSVLQKSRIDAAFAAMGDAAPESGITLIGYSAGASIAELMHQRWPLLFSRLVLIAPPMDPVADHLRKARGVVAMSCSLDVPYRMKAAVRDLDAVSVAATYIEMPKCTHGNIAEGERTFDDAFAWLDTHS